MKIPTAITQKVFRAGLVFKKQAPNIMFAGGIVGVVAGTVMACRATLQLPNKLDSFQGELDEIKESNNDDGKDVAYIYAKNIIEIGRLYAPAVAVSVVSIGALTGSHVSLNRRNASLTAAYAALSKAYDEYRDRVRLTLGPDREQDIYHAASKEVVEMDDGTSKELVVVDPHKWSPYARFFDEGSYNFQKSAEMNRIFIQCQQNYANHLLQARGHVFLNDVYDSLGLERSSAGAVVGWVLSPDGDNYIDFGLFEASSAPFMAGWEPRILLDFNVDGVIYDKI